MTSSVQGHAYLFRLHDSSSTLTCEILHDRSLTAKELCKDNGPICFIDNVNLHKLPSHGFGSLVAISQNRFHKCTNDSISTTIKWEIAVLLHLDIRKTITCPCSFVDRVIKIHFKKMRDYHYFQSPFQIRYLNQIGDWSTASDDGYIECNVHGPDIVLQKAGLSSNIFQGLKTKKQSLKPIFKTESPQYTERNIENVSRKHPNSFMSLKASSTGRSRKYKTTSTMSSRTYNVNLNTVDNFQEIELHGFLFPIISRPFMGEFAILSEEDAKILIYKGSISTTNYSQFLKSRMKHKLCTRNIDVDENGIVIEVENSKDREELEIEASIDSMVEPFERDALLHAQWTFQSDSFKVLNWDVFEELFQVVYGDFKFERSCSSCFGLNTYLGKKTAYYVRPSPRMSKQSAYHSEYFRQNWDVTFMPIVRKIVSSLVQTSVQYQRNTDRFYDLFQRHCYRSILPSSVSGQCIFGSSHTRYSNLSILTFGNSKVSGFSNLPHVDTGDIWDNSLQRIASNHLRDLINLSRNVDTDNGFHSLIRHLRRLSMSSVDDSFSNYTTCGYNIRFDDASSERVCVACFVYLYLNISVNIPRNKTVYHTFGGAMGAHATSVPILIDCGNVYFNHHSLSIFAWGGGQSPNVINYIRDKGGTIPSQPITRSFIKQFYERSNDEIKKEMRNMKYITQHEVDEINNRERNPTLNNSTSIQDTSSALRRSKRRKNH